MRNKDIQKKYSLRKFKGIGLASAVIGIFFANQSVYADVTSGNKKETNIAMDLERVSLSSSAKTTFTDDQNSTKKVTVDVVFGNVDSLPTKANENTEHVDGTDSVRFTSKATVNYLLEEDHTKLQDSKTVDGNSGTIKTPYDRKGIAADVDGKDYRESTVEKTGSVGENTGKEEKIQVNNKEYEWVRSEVVDSDKATYEKTHFNDIEAPVSPEGMHNNLGEINYGKITGKVYLVEETSNGQYGKFVEATNINSDDEAVEAWKNGQATAKDFTKENVTLQKGDTILVLDRDTYAHGSGKRTVNTVDYRRELVRATPEFNRVESSKETKDVNAYPTYALFDETVKGKYVAAGADHNFGTSDDGEVTFNGEQYLHYYHGPKLENDLPEVKDTPELDFSKSSLNEIMRYMQSEIFGVLEYFDYYAKTDAERQLIQERRTKLEQNIADTIQMIKNENISMAAAKPGDIYTSGMVFYSPDREKLTALKKQIESAENLLDEIMFTLNTREEVVEQYENLKNVKKVTKEVLYYEANHKNIDGYRYGYPKFSHRIITSYHKDAVPEHYSDWEKVKPESVWVGTPAFARSGNVTISDDLNKINVVYSYSSTVERDLNKREELTKLETDYVVKELITPVRAYKVMEDGGPVVNHYYRMATRRSNEPILTENTKVGTVIVHYVSNTGEELKEPKKVVTDIPYEITKTYAVMSGTTKVGEESVVEKLKPVYDTTPERLNTIIADKTGFTYEFDALAVDSAPGTGVFNKQKMIVKYVYHLVSKEDPTPVKKEVKGSVVVKYVDTDGNEIKDTEKVVTDAVLKTTKTYTTKSGNVLVSTRDEVENHEIQYNTAEKKVETITKDGKKYNYQGIYAPSEKFHNVIAEIGKVVEGITTIVYQYQLEPEKVQWEVSQETPIVEVPEYRGGSSLPEAPINEVQDYGGGVVALEPPIYTKPTLIITKWVDENGTPLKPADVKSPVELGLPNEAFEHGTIEGYKYIGTIRSQEGDVVTHVFRKLNSEPKVSNAPQRNSEKATQEEQKVPEVTPESPKNEAETPEEISTSYSVYVPQANQLPQTGTGNELALLSAATSAILAGLGIARSRKKQ